MPITTRLSDLLVLGYAKETTFGTYVAPTNFLPVHDAMPEVLANPVKVQLMRNSRAAVTQSIAGIRHNTLGVVAPLFPDAGMGLHVGCLGQDQGLTGSTKGKGISGTPAANFTNGAINTTLNGSVSISGTTAVLTSATGFASNQVVVFEAGTVRAETFLCTLSGSTLTLVAGVGATSGASFASAHGNGTAVAVIGGWSTGSLTTASTSVGILAGLGAKFAVGDIIQIDYNTGTTVSSEIHTITSITTDTLNFTDATVDFSHLINIAVFRVIAPFTHTVYPLETNALPSFSFDVNLNGADLQFFGSLIGKTGIKLATAADAQATYTCEVQQTAVNGSPPTATWPADTAYGPTQLSLQFGSVPTTDTTVTTAEITFDNTPKVYDTLASQIYPTSIVAIERKIAIKASLYYEVLTGGLSLQDYYTSLGGGTTFQIVLVATAGTNILTYTFPACVLDKYPVKIKKGDIGFLDLEATATLTGQTRDFTLTIANAQTRPY